MEVRMHRKRGRRIRFHNREREIKEIMNIIESEPMLITFVYGPINSGKTELFNHVIGQLSQDNVVFYVNLRGKFIREYSDFIRVLFKIERGRDKEDILRMLSDVSARALKFMGIPVAADILNMLFKERTYEDAFEFLEEYFTEIAERREPILILDELQVIKDVRIDDLLIYKLFNFFVRLTKELHLCHVFAVTSDSLFIERIYNEAMLHGRCRYLLVDDFDKETAVKFLKNHGLSEEESEKVWNYVGGKPVYLIEIINSEDREEKINELLSLRTGEIASLLKFVKELGDEVAINGKSYAVNYEQLIYSLNKFMNADEVEISAIDEVSKRYLVKKNILFVEPLRRRIRPQSRLDLLAIREALSETAAAKGGGGS